MMAHREILYVTVFKRPPVMVFRSAAKRMRSGVAVADCRIEPSSPLCNYGKQIPGTIQNAHGARRTSPSSSSLFLSRGAEVFPCFPTVNENQIASPHDPAGRRVVHGDAICREPMWLVETGTSADPRDTQVVCDCERSLSLEQAFQRGRLGRCNGERPWLGDRDPAGCDVFLRLLTRTATNTYFPQLAAVISLPAAEDVLSALMQGHFSDLDAAQSAADIAQGRRFNSALRASLEGYSDEDVFARLQQLR